MEEQPRDFRYKYWMDRVPLLWKPLYLLYGYSLGWLYAGYLIVVRMTSRIVWTGVPLDTIPSPRILCLWHRYGVPHFVAFYGQRNQYWISHPYWYMKPAIVALRIGIVDKFFLGSSGNSGMLAADKVIEKLTQGGDTTITPDGPSGPRYDLKRGVYRYAIQSGARIVPLKYRCRGSITLPGWDAKVFPLPFCKLEIHVGNPIGLDSEEGIEATAAILRANLGE